MLDLLGQTLGQYQIVAELGRGGMAVVYRAHQPSLNRDAPTVRVEDLGFRCARER